MKVLLSWTIIILAAVIITAGVATGLWPVLLIIPVGAAVALLVFYYPITGIIIYILGEPIFHNFVGISLGANIPDLKFNRLMAGLILTSLFFRYVLRRWKIRPPGRIDFAMLLLSAVVLVNCFRFPNATINIQWFFNGYGLAFILYLLIRNMQIKASTYRLIFHAILASGLYMCLLGIYQEITGTMLLVPDDLTSVHIRQGRMTGTYGNAVEFGMLMNTAFITTIYLLMTTRDRVLKWFYGAVAMVMVFCLYMSMVRAVWFGFILVLIIIGYHYPRAVRWLAVGVLMSIALLVMFWPVFIESDVVQNRLLHSAPLMDRASNYQAFSLIFPQRPVFGIGYSKEAWIEALLGVMGALDTAAMHHSSNVSLPHNEFVLTIVMIGLFGLFFLLYLFFEVFRASSRLKVKLRDPHLLMLFQATGVMLLVNAFFADIINFFFSTHLVMIMLALADNPAAWKSESIPSGGRETPADRMNDVEA